MRSLVGGRYRDDSHWFARAVPGLVGVSSRSEPTSMISIRTEFFCRHTL